MVNHESWMIFLSIKKAHGLNIPCRINLRVDVMKHKFITIQGVNICEETWYKVVGLA
jgi:hypothetical protein